MMSESTSRRVLEPSFSADAPTSYWTMNFDASPKTLHSLDNILKHDPRVIRWTMIKMGEKVEDIVQPPSKTFKS